MSEGKRVDDKVCLGLVNALMVALPRRASPPIASYTSIPAAPSAFSALGLCAPAPVFRGSVGRPGCAGENGTGTQRGEKKIKK